MSLGVYHWRYTRARHSGISAVIRRRSILSPWAGRPGGGDISQRGKVEESPLASLCSCLGRLCYYPGRMKGGSALVEREDRVNGQDRLHRGGEYRLRAEFAARYLHFPG